MGARLSTFYVSGASSEFLRVREVTVALAAAGLEPSCDWTTVAPEYLGRDHELSAAHRLALARAVLQSTRGCTVLVLLVPRPPAASIGAWVELGAAIEARRRRESPAIVVAGPDAARTIFTDLADAVCESDEEAVATAVALAATFARAR